MRRPWIAGFVWIALAAGLWTAFHSTATAQPPGTPPPGTQTQGTPQPGMPPGGPPRGMRPPGGMMPPAATDSFAAERDSLAKVVLESIAGKENMPAESVFKSIKIMKGVPAARLV